MKPCVLLNPLLSCIVMIGLAGCGGPPDPLSHLKILAKEGDVDSQWALCAAYSRGEGVPVDSVESYKWCLSAAENGHVEAQFQMGKYSEKNALSQEAITEAAKWFRLAAEQGHEAAPRRLEIIQEVGKHYMTWAVYLRAEQGDAVSQNVLGGYYEHGYKVPKNFKEAMRWRIIAAKQGNPAAQYMVGRCYKNGVGVPSDLEEAAKWFRLAAEQGDDGAQLELGIAYATGKGVPFDLVTAYQWVNLSTFRAAGAGDEEHRAILEKVMTPKQVAATDKKASEIRDKLEEMMKPDQIAEAQRLSREWVLQRSRQIQNNVKEGQQDPDGKGSGAES